MRLIKGSQAAKRYMAKIRAKKNSSVGAVGDYAKFEIAVIKKLATLLKQPYKKTQETVNTSETLLNIISVNFDKKVSVNETAKQLKAKLIEVNKKSPIQSFIQLLSKLPKKETQSNVKFPIKLPATVTIGSIENLSYNAKNYYKIFVDLYPNTLTVDTTQPSKDKNKAIEELEKNNLIVRVNYNKGFADYKLNKNNIKKLGSVKASKEIKKTLKDKNLYLPHGYKTVKRKRKIGEVHTDTKSHNVKINVLSGINPYIEKIKITIQEYKNEIDFINKELKLTTQISYKKTLRNRKIFLISEIKNLTQFLKKF